MSTREKNEESSEPRGMTANLSGKHSLEKYQEICFYQNIHVKGKKTSQGKQRERRETKGSQGKEDKSRDAERKKKTKGKPRERREVK